TGGVRRAAASRVVVAERSAAGRHERAVDRIALQPAAHARANVPRGRVESLPFPAPVFGRPRRDAASIPRAIAPPSRRACSGGSRAGTARFSKIGSRAPDYADSLMPILRSLVRRRTAPQGADLAFFSRILQEGYGPGAWHGADIKAAIDGTS